MSAKLLIPSVEVHQLREGEEAVAARFVAADDLGDGGYGVGAVGLRESVGVLTVVQQGEAAGAEAGQDAALDGLPGWTVPVPRHNRLAHAPEAELFGYRDDLGPVPVVNHPKQLREGAHCVVDGFLSANCSRIVPGRLQTRCG